MHIVRKAMSYIVFLARDFVLSTLIEKGRNTENRYAYIKKVYIEIKIPQKL